MPSSSAFLTGFPIARSLEIPRNAHVHTPQNLFFLSAVKIKPAGLIGILEHGKNPFRTRCIQYEIAVIRGNRYGAAFWQNGVLPGIFRFLLPVQIPRTNKFLVT